MFPPGIQFRRMEKTRRTNRIFELRSARGLSFRDIAKACVPETNASQVQKLEAGDRSLDLDWMRRIAAVFRVKPSELLLDDDVECRLSAAESALLAEIRSIQDSDPDLLVAAVKAVWRAVAHIRSAAELNGHLSGDPVLGAQLADVWAPLDNSQKIMAVELIRMMSASKAA